MDDVSIARLEAQYPSQNVRHLASLPKQITIRDSVLTREVTLTLEDEMVGARQIYGEAMRHPGPHSTDAEKIEIILDARRRYLAMTPEAIEAMREREVARDEKAGRTYATRHGRAVA